MDVCVFGAAGMLGRDLVRHLGPGRAVGFGHRAADITAPDAVAEVLDRVAPRVVVNCAAFTRVDACETERDAAFAVNGTGAGHVARACAERNLRLIHLSTDYVFDGGTREPVGEDAPPNPLGVYGASKLAGERAVRDACPDALIVRTAWLFGLHGPNFVETMLRLAAERERLEVVNDQHGSPTYTDDLAHALVGLAETDVTGLMHVTNAGTCTWFDFARAIFAHAGVTGVTVVPVTTTALGRPAPRPAYSVLDCSRYAAVAGAPLRSWEDALRCYLEERDVSTRAPAP